MSNKLIARLALTDSNGESFNYFGFQPNQAAAIIMAVAFGMVFGIALTNLICHRKQIKGRYLWVFVFCPLGKQIGYAIRSAAAKEPTNFNLFISSNIFLFLTPQICAATAYLTFAGLVFYVDEQFSLIGCKTVALVFLGADVLASAIQGAGAGQIFGGNLDTWKIGAGICLGGMIIEFLSFSCFSVVVLHFGYRYRQNKERIPEPEDRIPIVDRILIALYINLAGQFVRAVYRLHQFAALLISLDPHPEVYQYVFDALPIFFCTLALSVILPWQLDFAKAIGDVVEKLEWGLLAPIVWPIKKAIRKRREEKARKAQELREDPVEIGQELHQLPKDQLPMDQLPKV